MAGIYAHIPFCHSKCAYCDFYSMPNLSNMPALADALRKEYEMRKGEIGNNPVRTIYFGGGTPSIMPTAMLASIAEAFPSENVEEFTIEANPEDITVEKVRAWRQIGVNRVSMGVQSFIDRELQAISRRHSAADAMRAVEILREAGIDNISLDLIYGLPHQTLESWKESLHQLMSLRPQHLSAYLLSYEHGTRLTAMLRKGEISEASDETIEDMYAALCSIAREHGYQHYEISNFALPGYESKHNSSYWDNTPYLGLGPSAHSYDGRLRRINAPNLKHYLQAINSGATAYEIDEEDDNNRYNDYVMTRLRTAKGIDTVDLDKSACAQLLSSAETHIKRGTLVYDQGRLHIPEKHWLISNSIISDLMAVD